jgi:PAS domain S-box-containing protein
VPSITPVRFGSIKTLPDFSAIRRLPSRGDALRASACACAAIAGLFATSVIVGWYAKYPALLRLESNYVAVQFNTALCFLLAAGALAAFLCQRTRPSLALSVSAMLLTGTTLVEHLTGWSAGIDEMLWPLGVSRDAMEQFANLGVGTPGRMSPNAAVALTLLAFSLVIVTAPRLTRLRLVAGAVAALAATTAGAIAFAGYLMGVPSAYGWGHFTPVAPQSAATLLVLGLGVLFGTGLAARSSGLYTGRVAPGLAAATVMIAALFMWEALRGHDRRDLETAVLHQANAVASDLSRSIDARTKLVDRLVQQRAFTDADSPAARRSRSTQVIRDFPGIAAITRLDSTGSVTWRIADGADNGIAIGSRFAKTPLRESLLHEARRRGRAVVSAPVANTRKEPSLFIASPTSHSDGTSSGYLVVELTPELLLDDAVPEEFAQMYGYAIEDAGVSLGHSRTDVESVSRFATTVPIAVRGGRWQLTVVPAERTIDESLSAVPIAFLLAAIACAIIAGWIVRSAQIAAEQSETLARTVTDLASENEARREAELLRDEHADMLQVQTAELGLQYSELQSTASELALQRDELRRAQEFSAALVRSTVDAVAAFDLAGRVHAWNPAMAALTGHALDDFGEAVVGRLLPFLAIGEEVRLLQDALAGRATTMHALRASHQMWRDDVRLDLTVTPMRSADGQLVGGLLVARDVTEQQRGAEVILASKEAAEQANRAKSDFLARMSHELRTPLNAVIGFTNVIRRNADNRLGKADITYLDRIGANGKHLLTLINTVLDLSKIESGCETVELGMTSISTLVRDTIAELEVRATESGVQLQTVTPWGAHAMTDESKLKQVFINLLGNAIKFTPRGGSVFVRVEADPFTGTATRIDVEDTGIGIPADRIHAIFEAFEQADSQTSHKYGGTGLGLAISQKLCALMGHDLIVESQPGKGSTFSILFATPRAAAAA